MIAVMRARLSCPLWFLRMNFQFTDEELVGRLQNFEDSFVEKKTSGDHKDWVKTIVAFANSAPAEYPAVLFIGVRDDGRIEPNLNLDSLQKTLNEKLSNVFPPVYIAPKILEKDAQRFLAVIVPGSLNRPHFSGLSYIRSGSETLEASPVQFERLIASRNTKTYEILKWKGKNISVSYMRVENVHTMGAVSHNWEAMVADCDQFVVHLAASTHKEAIPLGRVEVSFDSDKSRLKLEIKPI